MENHTVPENYIIRFEKDHDIELDFIGEVNGKLTYSKSLLDFGGFADNEKNQLTITIEQTTPTSLEKAWYSQKSRLMKKDGECVLRKKENPDQI